MIAFAYGVRKNFARLAMVNNIQREGKGSRNKGLN